MPRRRPIEQAAFVLNSVKADDYASWEGVSTRASATISVRSSDNRDDVVAGAACSWSDVSNLIRLRGFREERQNRRSRRVHATI